jgi:hypothetical protein
MHKRSEAAGLSQAALPTLESLQTGGVTESLDVDSRVGILGSTEVVSWAIQPDDLERSVDSLSRLVYRILLSALGLH